jgi:hypothetical protein
MRPKKFEWMKELHEILRGIKLIMFHGLPILPQAYLFEVGQTQHSETMTLQNLTTLDLV